MATFGRRRIFTDVEEINSENIAEVIKEAMVEHRKNSREIRGLRHYLAGNQPVLNRVKKTREDINNKVVVNIASEVMDFKLSYIFGAPLDIVRAANAEASVDITPFKRMMIEQGKDDNDQAIALDMFTGALGYRGVLPNPNKTDEAPFCLVRMLPETTFIVYKNDVFRRKMLGVSYVVKNDDTVRLTAYTDSKRYELVSDTIDGAYNLIDESDNGIGLIPIVEYTMPEGMGVFEKAVPQMDAYNTATSNRIDDIEQFIQSILAIFGVDLKDEHLEKLKTSLCLVVPDVNEGVTPQAKYLVNSLDQTSVQAVMDDLYYHILEVCSVPGREQSSGGNTGAATELGAGGWRKAQYSAERIISAWKAGDRDMYRIALAILNLSSKTPEQLRNLRSTDFETKFTLSKSNNLLSKTQALTTMLQSGINPRIAIREVDLFSDPEAVYEESKETLKQAFEKNTGADQPKETGDVTNQPKGDDGVMEQTFENKGIVQKPD